MKKTVFKKQTLRLKQSTIESTIDALCSADSITRKHLADSIGASLNTVSKIVNALLDSGAVVERRGGEASNDTSAKGMAPLRLSLSNRICTAVIDLSSSVYSVNLISKERLHVRYTHKYDATLDFRDNLYDFLSRGFSRIRLREGVAMNICVIYADISDPSRFRQSYLPNETDKDIINGALYDICRRFPDLYIPKSQAISDAVKFGVIKQSSGFGGVSFLSLGDELSAFSVSGHDIVTPCRIHNLFIRGNITADEFIKNCFTNDQFDLLLEKAINFIDAAFGSETVIVESDSFEITAESIRSLSRSFARSRLTLPMIHTVSLFGETAGVTILSAARRTEAQFIKSLILNEK